MTDVTAPGAPAELPALYASGRRKRQRSRRLRIASYVIGVAILGSFVLFADWEWPTVVPGVLAVGNRGRCFLEREPELLF